MVEQGATAGPDREIEIIRRGLIEEAQGFGRKPNLARTPAHFSHAIWRGRIRLIPSRGRWVRAFLIVSPRGRASARVERPSSAGNAADSAAKGSDATL